jgi:class 3 adenylate cyclase
MAIAMQRLLRELRSEWRDMGLEKPFQLRIGINTGFCTVGNFGSEDRMEYTIIGHEGRSRRDCSSMPRPATS